MRDAGTTATGCGISFQARSVNNTLCLRGLNLYRRDKNMRMTCFLRPYVEAHSHSGRRDTGGGRMEKYHLRGMDQIIHLFFMQGFCFFCPELLDCGGKLKGIKEQVTWFTCFNETEPVRASSGS